MKIQHHKNVIKVKNFLVLITFFTLFFSRVPSDPAYLYCQTVYLPKAVTDGGAIRGNVTLKGNPHEIVQMDISQDNKTCGKTKPSPRLIPGNGGVANAVIYLEDISTGKAFPPDATYLLDQHTCEYVPHILIIPAGRNLTIVNSDAVLHNVHSYETSGEKRTVFNIAQPIKGVKSSTKPLTTPGFLTATCDAGHPWMSAYIVVAPHPYYTLTDKNGNYLLENIPAGTYTLHLWHEGVTITKREMEHDKVKRYEFEAPYDQSRKVTITPNTTTTVNLEFSLR